MSKFQYTYQCVAKGCREYHRPFTSALGPAAVRLATGGPVCCAYCFKPVHLKHMRPV